MKRALQKFTKQEHNFKRVPSNITKPVKCSELPKIYTFFLLLGFSITSFTQQLPQINQDEIIQIKPELKQKVMSGHLFEKVSVKQKMLKSASIDEVEPIPVILYFVGHPSEREINKLTKKGIEIFRDTWTPPVGAHKHGFFIASLPAGSFEDVLSFNFVKKIAFGGHAMKAHNNTGTGLIRAQDIWSLGYKGKGVKIGIMDSGIDLSFAGTEFPANFEYKDYSAYPLLDDVVKNYVTGHGTHVAGTALGRGVLSEGHSNNYNGEGAFTGVAPEADMVFFKIGDDTTARSSSVAVIAAIDAAINIYDVDILSYSYGGWEEYHDGSSAAEQKVDWCVAQGVPFITSAGNSADDRRHWSGTIPANSESDFIEINTKGADSADTKLWFNLVWQDGTTRKDITLGYYDENKQPYNLVTILPVTESLRGTESQLSHGNDFLPKGDHVFFLKIINNSDEAQFCHIYETWDSFIEGNDNTKFVHADPFYTIGSPALCDSACAVGAYVSRTTWNDYAGGLYRWAGEEDSITYFSSRGPRIDGHTKPDICAPGMQILSVRDKDVYTEPNYHWIDNDGILNEGGKDYYRMMGTSMACPFISGAAALYLQKYPNAKPYVLLKAFYENTDKPNQMVLPNNTWGNGKLNMASVFGLPTLIVPKNNFAGISETPDLHWKARDEATSYHVQVATDSNFSEIVYENNQVATNSENAGTLDFNSTYFWRIRCNTAQGEGNWSAPWSFTTGNQKTDAGYAMWFDGQDDYIEFPHSAAIDPLEQTDEVTIEAWVYVEKYDWGWFPIFENFLVGVNWAWSLVLNDNIGTELHLIWNVINSEITANTDRWVHVAISYSKVQKKIRFYYDGELMLEKDFDADIPDSGELDPIYIARNKSGADEYAAGMIDEIRIWGIARTGEEIKNNMFNKLKNGTSDLVASFSFDEGKGSTVSEATGNFANGQTHSLPVWMISSIPLNTPEVPVLISPADQTTQVSEDETLVWNVLANSESFTLEISTNSDFSNIVFSNSTLTKSRLKQSFLARGTTYFWRVKAKNRNGETAWSDVSSFKTIVSSIATLNDILVDNESIQGFDSNIFEYDIQLPYGTTAMPAIEAVTSDNYAIANVTFPTTVPGSASIEVIAEDGISIQSYTLNFAIAKNNDATLSDLKVDNTTLTDFDSAKLNYTFNIPNGSTQIPGISAIATDPNASIQITGISSIPGTAIIVVTAEDGTSVKTYRVEISFAPVGLNELLKKDEFYLFPNPNNGIFNVLSPVFSNKSAILEISDITGKKLVEKRISGSKETTVNVSSLKSGVYVCKIRSKNKFAIKKMVIQK